MRQQLIRRTLLVSSLTAGLAAGTFALSAQADHPATSGDQRRCDTPTTRGRDLKVVGLTAQHKLICFESDRPDHSVGFTAGRLLDSPSGSIAGDIEYDGAMSGADGSPSDAHLRVVKTGIGRVVELDTNVLPILPTGHLYELWFVGPTDAPGDRDRISAGTFHPDADGHSAVRFAAAVDPTKYPLVVITAEPGDGDPAPSDPDVLRARLDG
jgi:hypothetical protein